MHIQKNYLGSEHFVKATIFVFSFASSVSARLKDNTPANDPLCVRPSVIEHWIRAKQRSYTGDKILKPEQVIEIRLK